MADAEDFTRLALRSSKMTSWSKRQGLTFTGYVCKTDPCSSVLTISKRVQPPIATNALPLTKMGSIKRSPY
eukprot:1157514-Pelagomonas_calceolata.AAC.14